jgi:drug/metabolite transporter (DMT)-like permease
MVMSAFGFATMGALVKATYMQGIPVLEIVAARALVSALLSYGDVRRKGISLWGHRKGLLFARGAAGAMALFCVYSALVMIPFAEATVIQYLHPMFTALLAVIFLNERLRQSTMVCMLMSFAGLLIIVRPDFLFGDLSANYSYWAITLAVAGALGSAIAYVLVKKLNETEDTSVIIFYFPIIALPLSLILLGDDWVMPQGWTWLMLLMVGITTQVGQIGLTKAMQTASASQATSFSYLQVVFAIGLGVMFFDEIPTVWTLLGALCILASAWANVLSTMKTQKKLGDKKRVSND